MKIIFISLVSCFYLLNSAVAQDATDLYTAGNEWYNKGKYKKALSITDKAIKETPNKSKLYILKGQILYEMNHNTDEFFSYLGKAVEVEPDSPVPLVDRAYYYEQIGQIPNAILDYNDAIKLAKADSSKILIYTNLGGVYQKIQKFDIALENLLKGYEIDSNDIGILNNLAMCLDDLGRRDEATNYMLRIIEIDSTFIGAYINLGFQASLKGEYEKALKYLNKADELKPMEAFTLNNRGYVKLKLNDIKGALKDINNSIKIDPENSYAFRNRALVYLEKKNVEKSCEDLYEAKRLKFSIYFGDEVDSLITKHCIK